MNIDKKLLLVIIFAGALIVLLLVFFFITGFSSGIKDIISAVYFAIWVAAAAGMWLFGIQPYLEDRKKAKGEKKTPSAVAKTTPVPSPKSGLPLRDRVREYVTERRKEEGLPVPEPLLPSRSTGTTASAQPQKSQGMSGRATAAAVGGAGVAAASAASAGEGDLPLPDDFGESGTGDLFGDEYPEEGGEEPSLPGIEDDDLGSFDEGGEEDSLPGLGDDEFDLDDGAADTGSTSGGGDTGGLPDFDGELEPDMSDSDLSGSIDDFSEEESPSSAPDLLDEGGGGGLSDEGLDLDLPLDDTMMDDDMGGGDSDFDDIEFDDLEAEDT